MKVGLSSIYLPFCWSYHAITTIIFVDMKKKPHLLANLLQLLPIVYNVYGPFVVATYHLLHLQTFCGCCLLFVPTLHPLWTSNLRFTALLLPSSGNYCPMVKSISYFTNYNKEWKCIKELKN